MGFQWTETSIWCIICRVSISHLGHSGQPYGNIELAVDEAPELTLEDVMMRVARGDHGAFEQVYQVCSARVYGLARTVLRDPAQAEEVAQEAFLQIWTEALRFDPRQGSAIGWIMTITHRRAIDRVRSSQASRVRDTTNYVATFQRDFDPVGEAVENEWHAAAVRDCLKTLTEVQRESILLAYFGGLTQIEVGQTLAVPLGTVKSRIRDGLIRLRDGLEAAA